MNPNDTSQTQEAKAEVGMPNPLPAHVLEALGSDVFEIDG